MTTTLITTPRLRLRHWLPTDREPFAAMNADPRVMQFLPEPLTRQKSDAMADRIETHFAQHGFGLFALELPGEAAFAGFVGLSIPRFEAAFTPCVEIGWRLAAEFWNRGYATEAARAVLEFGFRDLRLPEIVSFTVPANHRSRRVMEKLGMTHNPAEDFDHPLLPPDHQLSRHVLYRMANPDNLPAQPHRGGVDLPRDGLASSS